MRSVRWRPAGALLLGLNGILQRYAFWFVANHDYSISSQATLALTVSCRFIRMSSMRS